MLKRYELTDQEWEQIVPLLPSNKGGRQKITVKCLIPWSGLPAVGRHGETFQSIMVHGNLYTAGFANGSMTEFLTISSVF